MRRALAVLLGIGACAPPDAANAPGGSLPEADALVDDSPADAPDTDAAPACTVEVAWVMPDDGASAVRVDAPIEVGFSAPLPAELDDAWTLSLVGVPGVATLDEDRAGATFVPDVPLAWDRPYVVEARVCDASVAHGFHTVREPVAVDALVGGAWRIDIAEGVWLTPGVSEVFAPLLSFDDVVLAADARPGYDLGLVAWSVDGTPSALVCDDAVDLGPLELVDNPLFRSRSQDLTLDVDGTELVLAAARLEGVFADDGQTLDDVSLHALLDTRLLAAALRLGDLCALAATFGDRCVPCPDGARKCLHGTLGDLQGQRLGPLDAPPTCR